MESRDPGAPPVLSVMGVRSSGVVSMWSAGAESLYGFSALDAVGSRYVDVVGASTGARDLKTYANLKLGDVWVHRDQIGTPGGQRLILQHTCTLAMADDGAKEMLICSQPARPGVHADVMPTAHIHSTAGKTELTSFCNEDRVILHTGPGDSTLCDRSARDTIGVSLDRFIHPDDVDTHRSAWSAAVLAPGETVIVAVRIRGGEHEWVWVEQHLTNMLADPAVAGVVVSSRDATDHQHAMLALNAAEQTLLGILESSVEGVILTGVDDARVYANPRMNELLGIDVSRLNAGVAAGFIDEFYREIAKRRVANALPGTREQFEFPITTEDGVLRWLRVAVLSRYDGAGDVAGTVVLAGELPGQRVFDPNSALAHVLQLRPTSAPDVTTQPSPAQPGPAQPSRARTDEWSTHKLTPREREVLQLLLFGDRVPSIAKTLFVSQSTVRNQLASIFRKFGVRSQQQLIDLLRDKESTHHFRSA